MAEKEGLRVGQTPGAVAEDGGQSDLCWLGQYTSVFSKSQPQKMEETMQKNKILLWLICFVLSVFGHAILIGALMWLSTPR